jgi:hypothetical protein
MLRTDPSALSQRCLPRAPCLRAVCSLHVCNANVRCALGLAGKHCAWQRGEPLPKQRNTPSIIDLSA